MGDAAGYVDAITGQGLTLAFRSARHLVESLPRPLTAAALPAALRRYDRSLRWAWLRYAVPARALLGVARRPWMRRAMIAASARLPWVFGRMLEAIV